MATISETTFSSAFPWVNFRILNEISLKYDPKGLIDNLYKIGSDNSLELYRWQAIIWTSDCLHYWRIYVSLSLDELTQNNRKPVEM